MKLFSKLCSIALIVFIPGAVYAAGGFTENGITGTTTVENVISSDLSSYGQILTKEVKRFNATSLTDVVGTGTYIYNPSSGTSSTAGSIDIKGVASVSEMLSINNYPGGTVSAAIEIGIGTNSTWYTVTTYEFTATSTVHFYEGTHTADRLRVGWKTNTAGSTTVTDIGSYKKILK